MMISRNVYWALGCLCLLANVIAARQLPQPERRKNGGIRGEKSAQLNGGSRQLKMEDDMMGDMGPCGMDSCSPSETPSVQPSSVPTVSPAPSQSPSAQPSLAPSSSPSRAPSSTPSISLAPSRNPSAQPTISPSSSPSLAPSISFAPTPYIWDLQTIDGYSNSTCIVLPPKLKSSKTVLWSLEYQYSMYLKEEDDNVQAQTMAEDLEPKLHVALAREALTCDYFTPDLDFFFVGLSAANEETVSGRCPLVTPDVGQSCWNVEGSIQLAVYYLPGNRRLVDETALIATYIELMETAFATLVDGVSLLAIVLQGFSNVNVIDTTIYEGDTGGDDTNSNGLAGFNKSPVSDDGPNFGPAIIGLAGVAFVVLVGLLAWRGSRRREAYLKHLGEVDDLSLEESVKEAMATRDFVVQEDDYGDEGWMEERFQKIRNEEEENHDSRKCAAATCIICSERAPQPIFIATELDSIEANVRAELGPKRYTSRRHQSVNDTVML